jgi:acyl-CoA dehydrogenase
VLEHRLKADASMSLDALRWEEQATSFLLCDDKVPLDTAF